MKAKLLVAILVLAALLPLALMLSNLTKTGSLGEDGSKREAGTTTTFVETRQTQVQTTTYETIIYSATTLPKAKQYALFEIIDIPGKISLSAVYFKQVPGLDAVYYEPFPDGTVVSHLNATYMPRPNETLYLATLAFVIREIPRSVGSTSRRPFASEGMKTRQRWRTAS
jgi:hypothetical protein